MSTRPDVWLVRRNLKRGPTYAIRWRDPKTGKCRSKTCGRDKALARRLRSQKREELAKGIAGDPVDVPWQQFREEELTLAKGKMSEASRWRLQSAMDALELHCNPKAVGAVTYAMLERFVTLRLEQPARPKRKKEPPKRRCRTAVQDESKSVPPKKIQPETIQGDLSYIRAALNRARKRGHIHAVPELPTVRTYEKAKRILTPEEIEKLMDACLDDRQRAFVWLGVTLGRRMSALLNLRWQDITLEDRIVRIECREDWQTKGRRNDVCFLDTRGVELLRRLWDAAPKMVADGKAVPKHRWVFLSESGERWGHNIQRVWRAMIKRAGIPHARIQSMKHTFVSGLVAAGVQQSIVTAAAAHRSPATTYKYYTSVADSARREAVSRLPWVASENERCANSAHGAIEGA